MSWRGYKSKGNTYRTQTHHYFIKVKDWKCTSLCGERHKLAYEEWIDTPMPHCKKCEKIITNHPEQVVAKLLKQEHTQ